MDEENVLWQMGEDRMVRPDAGEPEVVVFEQWNGRHWAFQFELKAGPAMELATIIINEVTRKFL